MKDADMKDAGMTAIEIIGIVGAGVMGTGIAQIAATAGLDVRLFDLREGAAAAAIGKLGGTFDTLVGKGKIAADDAAAALARVSAAGAVEDLGGCDLVIEAIVENLEAKRALFAALEAVVGEKAILATNTSSLSVTAIAAACGRPGRVAGLHFFNPVPLMRVVEVIPGFHTDAQVTAALVALTARLGHRGVVARDTPGFIVNHAGRAYGTEALRLVEEGVAGFAEIDRILRGAAGFRMGPFELFDLTGLDVSHPATEAIFTQFYGELRYKPSYLAQQRVAAGRLGRKSGKGFFDSTGERAQPETSPAAKAAYDGPAVWLAPDGDRREDVRAIVTAAGGVLDDAARPAEGSLLLVMPLGEDATCIAQRHGLDAARAVALDTLLPLDRHRTLMTTPVTDARYVEAALALFGADGHGATVIRDSLGFVTQRVLAMVINLAAEIAQQRIATPADIDDAVRLGLGYPSGPLAWGDSIGPERICTILSRITALSGDARYRPGAWLRRRAALGLSLMHED
jgi:3-hydroxybutyryl-CoA dehydrogenase